MGVRIGAGVLGGISGVGGNSGGGTGGSTGGSTGGETGGGTGGGTVSDAGDAVGGGADDSLAIIHVEPGTDVTVEFSPRGRFDLVVVHDPLGRGLGRRGG